MKNLFVKNRKYNFNLFYFYLVIVYSFQTLYLGNKNIKFENISCKLPNRKNSIKSTLLEQHIYSLRKNIRNILQNLSFFCKTGTFGIPARLQYNEEEFRSLQGMTIKAFIYRFAREEFTDERLFRKYRILQKYENTERCHDLFWSIQHAYNYEDTKMREEISAILHCHSIPFINLLSDWINPAEEILPGTWRDTTLRAVIRKINEEEGSPKIVSFFFSPKNDKLVNRLALGAIHSYSEFSKLNKEERAAKYEAEPDSAAFKNIGEAFENNTISIYESINFKLKNRGN